MADTVCDLLRRLNELVGCDPPPAPRAFLTLSLGGFSVTGVMDMAVQFPVDREIPGIVTFKDVEGDVVAVDDVTEVSFSPEGVVEASSEFDIVDEDDVTAVRLNIKPIGAVGAVTTLTVRADADLRDGNVREIVGTAELELVAGLDEAVSVDIALTVA